MYIAIKEMVSGSFPLKKTPDFSRQITTMLDFGTDSNVTLHNTFNRRFCQIGQIQYKLPPCK